MTLPDELLALLREKSTCYIAPTGREQERQARGQRRQPLHVATPTASAMRAIAAREPDGFQAFASRTAA